MMDTVMSDIKINYKKPTIDTEQDYQELKVSLLRVVEMVKTDRTLALELLVGTGMYDENGVLKKEYQ